METDKDTLQRTLGLRTGLTGLHQLQDINDALIISELKQRGATKMKEMATNDSSFKDVVENKNLVDVADVLFFFQV